MPFFTTAQGQAYRPVGQVHCPAGCGGAGRRGHGHGGDARALHLPQWSGVGGPGGLAGRFGHFINSIFVKIL